MNTTVENEKTSRIQAWRCIGCGKVEAPQPCIGVCQDRKVELVDAELYDKALASLEQARREKVALKGLVQQLAYAMPHDGQWEHSYRYLQSLARKLLAGS